MTLEWMPPLVISVMRLVFITTLFLVNWVALWRLSTARKTKQRDSRRAERLLVTSIVVVSLVYLAAVWAPFTLSALKHDLQDLQGGARVSSDPRFGHAVRNVDPRTSDEHRDNRGDEFTVEYIDLSNGEVYSSRSEALSRSVRAVDAEGEADKPSASFTSFPVTSSSVAPLTWSSDEQDLITSSCAYSLAFTAVARLAILRRPLLHPRGSWGVGAGAGVLVGVPAAVTVLVRTLGGTTPHFAPHQPEVTSSGYFLYSIICDAHITQAYVISLFLEWAALFTLLLVILAVVVSVASRASKTMTKEDEDLREEEEEDEGFGNMETWARDAVLTVGALWAWPLKPTLVLILYCVYGPHWTNIVCWLAHVVIAIPTVFIPLAVFLSSQVHSQKGSDLPTAKDLMAIEKKKEKKDGVRKREEELESSTTQEKEEEVKGEEEGASTPEVPSGKDSKKTGESHRENLKFYLGTDILKYGLRPAPKSEDRKMILTSEWGLPSISEV